MTKTAIVTTTINRRPSSFKHWAEQGDLVVAGDTNTPDQLRDYVRELGGTYLDPTTWFPGDGYVPHRCIQRRNAAIWWAIVNKYDYVITVDDDNTPVSPKFVELLTGEIGHQPHSTVGSRSGFLNLGNLCIPAFHQRGTPYGVDTSMNDVRRHNVGDGLSDSRPTVVVAQAMVIGDPDCDAVDRIVNSPNVVAVQNRIVVTPGVHAAFNSQATAWRGDWAPVMAVMPSVGRYDDIFASFIFHRLAKTYHTALYAGDPVVRQDRNPHNLNKDLAAELFGMSVVFEFCARLAAAHISADQPLWESYADLIIAVEDILPAGASAFARAWVAGWRDLKS